MSQLKQEVKIKLDSTVSKKRLSKVLRKDLKMSYRKVHLQAVHADSNINRVLRREYVKFKVNIMEKNSFILNFDEASVRDLDFR